MQRHPWYGRPVHELPQDLQHACHHTAAVLQRSCAATADYEAAQEDYLAGEPGAYDWLRIARRACNAASAEMSRANAAQQAVMARYGIAPGWWSLAQEIAA